MGYQNPIFIFPLITPSGIIPSDTNDSNANKVHKLRNDLWFTLNVLDQMLIYCALKNLLQGMNILTSFAAANTTASNSNHHSPSSPLKRVYDNMSVNTSKTDGNDPCALLTKLTTRIDSLNMKVSSLEGKSEELVDHISTLSGVVTDLKSEFKFQDNSKPQLSAINSKAEELPEFHLPVIEECPIMTASLNTTRSSMQSTSTMNPITGPLIHNCPVSEECPEHSETKSMIHSYPLYERTKIKLFQAENSLSMLIDDNELDDNATLSDLDKKAAILKQVVEDKEELLVLTKSYENLPHHFISFDMLTAVDSTISRAKEWIRDYNKVFHSLGGNCPPLDNSLFGPLEKFSEKSDMTIYEFLKKFEYWVCNRCGSKAERAFLLHEFYLESSIQDRTFHLREKYDDLVTWLKKKFGDPVKIAMNILERVIPSKLPGVNSLPSEIAIYARSLECAMLKIDGLWSTPGMNICSLEHFVYSKEFIQSIFERLPDSKQDKLYTELDESGCNIYDLHGKFVFDHIRSKVSLFARVTENIADKATMSDLTIAEEKKKSSIRNVQDQVIEKKCPILGAKHKSHSSLECKQFLEADPQHKRSYGCGSLCYVCLGPYSKCKSGCIGDVPTELLCQICKHKFPKSQAPLIIMCTDSQHRKKMVDNNTCLLLEKYFKGLSVDKYNKQALFGL